MSSSPSPTPTVQEPTWLKALDQRRRPTSTVLLALAVLFALLCAWMAYKFGWQYASVAIWSGLLALVTLCGGVWLRLSEGEEAAGPYVMRLFVLTIGGLAGLATWLLSLSLAYQWRATLLGGLDAWQGDNWWRLWVCALALCGGLAVMFTSLMLARSVERFNPVLRRLLYGYNAGLTGLLLLAILMVLNVLVYNYLTAAYDWTEGNIYSLSDRSKNVLRGLEKTSRIYVILPRRDISNAWVPNLMDSCRELNDKLHVEYISPDSQPDRALEILRKFQVTPLFRGGILIVYGTEDKPESQFIKSDDLYEDDRSGGPGRAEKFLFKGEDQVISTLAFLQEGKARAIVYFLQGNGELDLKDQRQDSLGAGALRERLQKGNYEVKGLQLTAIAAVKATDPMIVSSGRVPDDASIVVVAGPQHPLPEHALKALREYMNPLGADSAKKRGKMVVLLDLVVNEDRKLVPTGMESFLAEFDVQVGNERLLSLPDTGYTRSPLELAVVPELGGTNPVASAFEGRRFILNQVRAVKTRPPGTSPAGSRHTTETFLWAFRRQGILAEGNLRADPVQLVTDLMREDNIGQRVSQEDVSVAVAVAQSGGMPSPGDPHAFMKQQGDQVPRLAAFGSSSWASNRFMTEHGLNYYLFQSTLAWLRERPSNIGVEPKTRKVFSLHLAEDHMDRMRYLPAMILFVAIMGLGTGVWIVRRR